MKLLLVEDSADDRLWIARLLRQGFPASQVTEVQTAEVALERLASESFDLVLSDNVLPGMSGVELVQAMRDALIFVPVLILTGYEDSSAVEDSISAGAVSILGKSALNVAALSDVFQELGNLSLRPLNLAIEPIQADTGERVSEYLLQSFASLYGDLNAVRNRMGHVDVRAEAEQIDEFERVVMECEGSLNQALARFNAKLDSAR